MKAFIYSLINYFNHYKLRSLKDQVSIPSSNRLLRSFGVQFLATPEDRHYLILGERSVVNAKFVFEAKTGQVLLGHRCYIGSHSSIISRNRIELGDDVTIAWGVTLYDHDSHSADWRNRRHVVSHFYDNYGRPDCFDKIDWNDVKSAPIKICDRVWIGFDAVVLKGVTIGEGAIVGARSVVAHDVEPYTVVAGNPAKVVKHLEQFVNDSEKEANVDTRV